MFFWFIGTAVVTVWFVFRDPMFDYRLLIVGAVLPGIVDSITFSVVLLLVLMLVTPRGTALRRTLLALPIGMLLHLVFTGAWMNPQVFWWPFLGWSDHDASHAVIERGWWNVPLELIGLGLCGWVFRRAQLTDPARRREFWRTGCLALPEATS